MQNNAEGKKSNGNQSEDDSLAQWQKIRWKDDINEK